MEESGDQRARNSRNQGGENRTAKVPAGSPVTGFLPQRPAVLPVLEHEAIFP